MKYYYRQILSPKILFFTTSLKEGMDYREATIHLRHYEVLSAPRSPGKGWKRLKPSEMVILPWDEGGVNPKDGKLLLQVQYYRLSVVDGELVQEQI